LKQKVLAYIYRDHSKAELLVFDHVKYAEVSPQVVGGTVEQNESPEDAIVREVFEEGGLKFNNPKFIGAFPYFRADINQQQVRHVFEFISKELPNHWMHTVSSGADDKGMSFRFYWLSVSKAKSLLVADMGAYL
jgi:8-oxo-dGTP pyrophosphatase MutT (NUDIX family)